MSEAIGSRSAGSATRHTARDLARWLRLFGIEPKRWASLRYLPRYLKEVTAFRRAGGIIDTLYPIIDDGHQSAGVAQGHYFHQDLVVASAIFAAGPKRHIDVGSRIDGFVAHVASFRPIEVIDIRALPDVGHSNIRFLQADLMRLDPSMGAVCDSLSCLHALEHFGLGRYGDPLDPNGHRRGFENLYHMLVPGGVLYLSVPIGQRATQFNAQRVFDPTEPIGWAATMELDLIAFDYVDDSGGLHRQQDAERMPSMNYGCGIYTWRKRNLPSSRSFRQDRIP